MAPTHVLIIPMVGPALSFVVAGVELPGITIYGILDVTGV